MTWIDFSNVKIRRGNFHDLFGVAGAYFIVSNADNANLGEGFEMERR